MNDFEKYLDQTGEMGYVEQVVGPIAEVSGLPQARPEELVVFEQGNFGQVMSINHETVQILTFSPDTIKVGTQVTRADKFLEIPVGVELRGMMIDPFGKPLNSNGPMKKKLLVRVPVEALPSGIITRRTIKKNLETGVTIVDLMLPLGRGQRELIIGDRKTGKTNFLYQVLITQAKKGSICVYALIGKKKLDIKKAEELFKKTGTINNSVIVATTAQDPIGVIHLTPYAAMSIAEYFRDQGFDVLLAMDDLSTHAKYYREISLLARRFPGRNSYPPDIFYAHARLMERAGNFATSRGEFAITCLPVVETTLADLSGYIQTNLMSMTDGHLFFDSALFSEGRRPAVNPFLSVTRVGLQTQTPLKRSIARELISFLNLYQKMQSFVHFGAELTATTRTIIQTGDKIIKTFMQIESNVIPENIQILVFALLWGNMFPDADTNKIYRYREKLTDLYDKDSAFKKEVDSLISQAQSLNGFIAKLREKTLSFLSQVKI